MNKNLILPGLLPFIPALIFVASPAYGEKDYSDYFAYDVSTVKYVETGKGAPSQAVLPTASAQLIHQPQPAVTQPKVSNQTNQTIATQAAVTHAADVLPPTSVQTPAMQAELATTPTSQPEPNVITDNWSAQATVPATVATIPAPASSSGYEIYADTSLDEPVSALQTMAPAVPQQPTISPATVTRAIASGDIQQLQSLHAQGADLQLADAQGTTYLHKAAAAGNLALVEFLLSAGVNPNATTGKQWTPLHHAARFGHATVVQALLKAGANPQQVNSDGFSPGQLAVNAHHAQVAALLQ